MRYDPRFDPDEPNEPELIISSDDGEHTPPRIGRLLILLGLLFGGFLLVHNVVPLYTDWLWFGEVGYRNVFTTTIATKTLLFFSGALLFFAVFYLNVRHARRLAPEDTDRFLRQQFGAQWGQTIQNGIGWILLGVGAFLSLWAGRIAAESWQNWLQFRYWTPFRISDPVFGNDIGFYIFRLPFLDFLWQFGFYTLVLTTAAVLFLHWVGRAIDSLSGLPSAAAGVRGHVLALLAALTAMGALGFSLSRYDLLLNENGVFTGAGYADLRYRLFAIYAQTVLLALTALACLAALWQGRSFRWPTIGIGAWLTALILLGNVVPAVMQKIYVEPNQLLAEQENIARNIRFTRQGFGLENVRVATFPAEETLNAAALKTNRDTLDNVRLWDYPYLGKVYAQLQTVQNYYKFKQNTLAGDTADNLDIDRYTVGGRLRQVMLAAREIDPDGLSRSAQTWQNLRLTYTHGYGLAMSPVNKIVQGGPDYFIEGIPPVVSPEAATIKITQPGLYYGQLTDDYVFVDTDVKEFDYPATEGSSAAGQSGTQGSYTSYQGKGGIRIGDKPLAKLAFSLRLGDANVMLSRQFKPTTRVLFRRDIRERVMTVAPFLQQDGDPYLVVNPDDGRLVWMLDGYTISDRYPYSTPVTVQVNSVMSFAPNYIRNSVKATVDAYDGTVTLYLADPKDPIAQTYSKIFPGLLKPLEQMPAGLRAHIRYPEDLFRLQRSVYALYHVDDPRVFYLKEDAWAIPVEPNTDTSSAMETRPRQMEPYYVIMRLPSGVDGMNGANSQEEFLLMSPMAPINREGQNILGWMAARCDGDRYGQLILYRFPQSVSVNGPSQVVALINSDTTISSQLSLLRQGGSTATFGNLLVIPIEKSLLYIAPLYVEAANTASRLPQLQKVVVAFGQRVAMDDTLEKALAQLFPGYNAPRAETPPSQPTAPTPTQPGPPATVPPDIRTLIQRAATQYEQAQSKLKAGDFAGYGIATKQLETTLKELSNKTK